MLVKLKHSRTCYRWDIILCTALAMLLSLTWIKIIIPITIFFVRIARWKAALLHRVFNYIIRFWYSKRSLVLIQNKSQKFSVTGIVQGFLIQRQSTLRDWTWAAVSESPGISGLEAISPLGCFSDTKLHSLVSSVKPTNSHVYEFSRNWGCLEDACQASFFCLISKITVIKLNGLWTFSCHSQVKPFFAGDFPISINHSIMAMLTLSTQHKQAWICQARQLVLRTCIHTVQWISGSLIWTGRSLPVDCILLSQKPIPVPVNPKGVSFLISLVRIEVGW